MTIDYAKTDVPLMRARGHGQAPPSQIKRVLHALRTRESDIATAEKKQAEDPSTWSKAGVKLAVQRRDYTRRRLEAMLAYANEHTTANKAPQAQASLPFLKHIAKCKEDIFLVTEAAAGHSGSDAAFEKLVKKYEWIVLHFSKPGKTPLEQEDAHNRGLHGIFDAALRFDPVRKGSGGGYAVFSTVAYSWVHRNTRARVKADSPEKVRSLDEIEEWDRQQGRSEDYSEGFPHQFRLRRLTTLRAKPYAALASQDRVLVSAKLTDDILTAGEVKTLYKEATSE